MTAGFVHDLFLYADEDDFLAGTVPFVRGGLAAGEPVLVAVGAAKIGLLRDTLGDDADAVGFADMGEIGRNPAHIIPVWRQFVNQHASPRRRLRGIGEPVWPGRRPAELAECHRHETLLNVAFGDGPAWSLLCPYDAGALDAA
ncbi:MAG: MEDS domain-containing protein, partial [Acidimicrobiales bacterium]